MQRLCGLLQGLFHPLLAAVDLPLWIYGIISAGQCVPASLDLTGQCCWWVLSIVKGTAVTPVGGVQSIGSCLGVAGYHGGTGVN